mmetsp:Transcript_985/g.1280  ORF Transcript_985/g.1280 Transcript_985/m.1280 type:complete len:2367 (-) Transcript_985:92-7192(-)
MKVENDEGAEVPATAVVSKHVHRRFGSVEDYVAELSGGLDKAFCIKKILIANNGVAAVKAIRSIRRWAYDMFGNEKEIIFVVMATPEDFRANAEYIRMGDVIVDVPGGSNNHNYANVTLIVELARLHGVHAVWAGWGHASENPVLPDELAKSHPPIKFIGPQGPPMRALGDKIGSTIIAQSAGVPCIGWNGSTIRAEYDKVKGSLPDDVYEQATVSTASQAEKCAVDLGFPVMIKASEGGGGKGIRQVTAVENVADAYRQVCGEVPGSPIFIMKLSQNSRHLEVQLLADEYGNAIALNGRDCSVQRRHQKIIEEGPPVAAKPAVWEQMEKAAVALAQAVHYTNAGTVEYLYSEKDAKFYFLELNPRLQVEHPVTEMITKVNLPAAQLQVAMGLPLYNIPEIRELYGRNPFEDDYTTSQIDFSTVKREDPNGHCIAVRITAENAEAGFKPTSGGIQELNFRSTPSVWGYFSMDSSGSIHEFADSQFGHLFARGNDREQARRNMVLALKELSIRGDISTTVDYIVKLMELDDFVANNINTAWLDGIIAQNLDGMGAAEAPSTNRSSRRSNVKVMDLDNHVYVVVGATILAYNQSRENEKSFLGLIEKGQLPSRSLLKMKHQIELILSGMKYKLCAVCNGADRFSISVNDDESEAVSTTVRVLSDGGYLIAIGGQSYVAYVTAKDSVGSGMRINVGGASVAFSADYDPTCLRSDVAGKLVKKLKSEGAHVKKGEAYAEIEVMKMFMPLKVEESGTISWRQNEGAALQSGDLVAMVELDNLENVASVSTFAGGLNVAGWSAASSNTRTSTENRQQIRPHLSFRSSMDTLQAAMAGYIQSLKSVEVAWWNILTAVTSSMLPVLEIEEQLSVLNGRIPAPLFDSISNVLNEFKRSYEANKGSGIPLMFPANDLLSILQSHYDNIDDSSEKQFLQSTTTPLRNTILPYSKSKAAGVPGSERVLLCFEEMLRKWIATERYFYENKTFSDAFDNLRRAHKTEPETVLSICRAHEQLVVSSAIVGKILGVISDGSRIDLETTSDLSNVGNLSIVAGADSLTSIMPVVAQIGSIGGVSGDSYAEVALRARKLLMQASMPSLDRRKERILSASKDISESVELPRQVQDLLAERSPITEVLFSLLKSNISSAVSVGLLELYLRHLYRPYTLKSFDRDVDGKVVKFSFLNKRAEGVLSARASITSMTDLTRAVSSGSLSGSLTNLSEPKELKRTDSDLKKERIPANVERTGVCAMLEKMESLDSVMPSILCKMPQYEGKSPLCEVGPVNVLYFVVAGNDGVVGEDTEDDVAIKCHEALVPFAEELMKADVRRVSFIFDRTEEADMEESSPVVFTFRTPEFQEEILYRHIDPSLAPHLELNRIAANFSLKSLGSRHSSACHVHLYACNPKAKALMKDKGASRRARVFARGLNFELDFSSSSFERMLVDALNAFDLCSLKFTSDNHLFLSLVSDLERNVLDPVNVEQIVAGVIKRHSERISALGIAEVETRIVCCLDADSPPIAIRLFSSNPTGFVQVMNTYVEAAGDVAGERIFKLVGGTKASLASSGDSSWDGFNVDTPYPLVRPLDAQRKAALHSSDTVYCYDLPALFEAAVEQQWLQAAEKNKNGSVSIARPPMVMYTTELVVKKKRGMCGGKWSMQDYLLGNLELVQENRGAGGNDVGIVAWLVVLRTVEYPNGRQVVLIANDITVKAGSFGTREDIVFKMASEYAREQRIPRLFIAANSGARIGLADSVKNAYKVAFKDPSKPENGFDYIFVEKDVYETFVGGAGEENPQIKCTPVTYEGREVYRITDIIGKEPDLGVENLKGSGLIAGETSIAYREIFTMTIVLGRTVGIGAYLVRLGQRTIQKTSASPIILTGYQALNKLMGVDVYASNDQIGGPGIMYLNGISHQVAQDHLLAVKAAVDWISYVPSSRGSLLPITDVRGIDDVDRKIAFQPTKGVPYDPRLLITGEVDGDDGWAGGLFDRYSFTESLTGWAKSVVVGRARLGGIPMGVIITENRTVESIRPADPADLQASESILQEAGGVWFPNSAYKTAQSINDFRVEDLPLMVIANWRGFSGGQRDMFDEVLKYGAMIVDAFTAYEQPVFVFIPPFGEIRGGAWVVLDASINASVMEMYATKGTARGGVLEANGAASVKYRTRDLITTMHRLDDTLQKYDEQLKATDDESDKQKIGKLISGREKELLPVYEQISVQFCELHDTPGRMKAVGVIEKEVEWETARSYFYWRLRRKLAEFDLRRQLMQAGEVGRGVKSLTPIDASNMIRDWFVSTPGMTLDLWQNSDNAVLAWMAEHYADLEQKIIAYTKQIVAAEVVQVMTSGGKTAQIGIAGIVDGLSQGMERLSLEERNRVRQLVKQALKL